MISHADFGKMRLSDFVAAKKIVPLANWEFDDRTWLGEAVGFSEWLRLESNPEKLGSIALGEELPRSVWAKVLERLGLPLNFGMGRAEIEAALGKPQEELRYTTDRVSIEYSVGGGGQYRVSCTIHNEQGLMYLVVTIPAKRRARHGRSGA